MNEPQEPKELEEWMATWQDETFTGEQKHFSREQYLKKLWNARALDYGSIAILVFGIGLFGWVLWKAPSLFSASATAFFVPYFAWGIWMIVQRIRAEVRSLPLATTEYLDAIEHNLSLREKENRWEQRTIVPIVVAAAFIILWQIDRSPDAPLLMLRVIFVSAMVLPYALWATLVQKPKKLRNERENLERVKRQSSDLGSVD